MTSMVDGLGWVMLVALWAMWAFQGLSERRLNEKVMIAMMRLERDL